MAQVKVYGLKNQLNENRRRLSDTIHSCVVDALEYPPEKRFHRFFPMDKEDFLHPPDRSDRYTIIEISLLEGRTSRAKAHLIRLLFDRISRDLGITPQDVEITILESPMANWGLRGMVADEVNLPYRIDI